MGLNKKWSFYYAFSSRKCVLQRKSEDIQEISGTGVFFCCVRLSDHALTSLDDILCRMAEFRPPCFTVEFEAWQTYLLQPSTEKKTSPQVLFETSRQILDESASDPQQQLPLSCTAKWGGFRLQPCGSPCGNIRGKIWKYGTKQWQMFSHIHMFEVS